MQSAHTSDIACHPQGGLKPRMSLPCQNMQPQLLIGDYVGDSLVKPTGFISQLQLAVSLTILFAFQLTA